METSTATDCVSILFVDDEIRILSVFSSLLEDAGYLIKTASCAEDALRLIEGQRFDIVFLDQFLGQTRGLDLMKRMAETHDTLSFVIVTANGSADLAVQALKSGAVDFITKPFLVTDLIKSIEYVNKKRELDREKKTLVAKLELAVNNKTQELNRVYTHVLSTLAQAMEQRDSGTYGHSKRVSYNARLIAAALDLGEKEREDLKTAALLHDIGKIGITDFILGKEGPLSERERNIIKSHPFKGVEILRPLKQFEHILPSILHHHENYDGSGYPEGISGERIPLHARIISVADTYDAILSTRPYRSASDHSRAISELIAFSGKQFDPDIVDAFIRTDAKYRSIAAYSVPMSEDN
jgi:putative two-component system response regulator